MANKTSDSILVKSFWFTGSIYSFPVETSNYFTILAQNWKLITEEILPFHRENMISNVEILKQFKEVPLCLHADFFSVLSFHVHSTKFVCVFIE